MRITGIHQSAEMYGSDRSFLAAIAALASHESINVEATVVLPEPGPLATELVHAGIEVLYEPRGYLRRESIKRPLRFLLSSVGAFRRIRRLIKSSDVVYVNTVVCFAAIVALVFFGGRKIVHVRELPVGFEMHCFRLLLKASGAGLIYNSRATAEAFDLPGQVIHNGVESPLLTSSHGHRNSDSPVRLLLLGRISNWKGQDFLISSLSRCGRAFDVRIVGSPVASQHHLVDELSKASRLLAANKNIVFIPFSSSPGEHIQWADYVIVPSTKPEPFGRVAIEGFSYAKPVIGARHGGLVEIISDNENGFLFKPGSEDSLSSLLDQIPHRNDSSYCLLSACARSAYVSNFSLQAYQVAIRKIILG